MKFIIDAHLPPSLCQLFQENGYDAIHTSELPEQNATSDKYIILISVQEDRVVITKDSDFWHSFLIKKEPNKLILVKTGNVSTADLKVVFSKFFSQIIYLLNHHDVLILQRDSLEVAY